MLAPHPKNAEIYGNETYKIDEKFIENLKEGYIKPLLVKSIGFGKYMVISGNRRWYNSVKAGIDELECEVAEFDNEDEEIKILIKENMYRIKTREMIEKEALYLKRAGVKVKDIKAEMGISQQSIKRIENIDNFCKTSKNKELIEKIIKAKGHSLRLANEMVAQARKRGRKKIMKHKTPEKQVQSDIYEYLKNINMIIGRTANGMDKIRWYHHTISQFSQPGFPDLLIYCKDGNGAIKKIWEIEIKSAAGRQSPKQKEWGSWTNEASIELCGYYVVKSWTELHEKTDGLGYGKGIIKY